MRREQPTLMVSPEGRDRIMAYRGRERPVYVVRYGIAQTYGAAHIMVRTFDYRADADEFCDMVATEGGYVDTDDPVSMTRDEAMSEMEIAAECFV